MIKIEVKFTGKELAKVLHYYGYEDFAEKIVCPFHGDINASMKLDYAKGSFYCFGCTISGNAFDFVKNVEKVDDLESCKRYFKILKSKKVRHINVKHLAKRYKNIDNKDALVIAEDYYYNLKTINWKNEYSDVLEYMKQRGFKAKTLNLCNAKYTYNDSYPIIFPIMDNDNFRGWVCRTTNKQIEQKRKYLYNKGFSRATTLCGTHKAKTVVVVEGYMDMLKFKQFGIKNVVALLGWKATPNQIEELKKDGVEIIISALDNDKCGKKGTAYLKKFFNVVDFVYPKGVKDAGEMSQKQFDVSFHKTKLAIRRKKENGNYR